MSWGQNLAVASLLIYCSHIFFEKGINFFIFELLFTGAYCLFRGVTPQPDLFLQSNLLKLYPVNLS